MRIDRLSNKLCVLKYVAEILIVPSQIVNWAIELHTTTALPISDVIHFPWFTISLYYNPILYCCCIDYVSKFSEVEGLKMK